MMSDERVLHEQAMQRLKMSLATLRKHNIYSTLEEYAKLCVVLETALSAAYRIYDDFEGASIQTGVILRRRPSGLPPKREKVGV